MKILIEPPTWLGDAVMATPAIEALLEAYPKAEVTLVGSLLSTEALKFHPQVVQSEVLDKGWWALRRKAKVRCIKSKNITCFCKSAKRSEQKKRAD